MLALNWDSNNPAHQVAHFPEVFATEHFAVPQAELKAGGWQLEPPTQRRLLERLRKAGQPLGDFCQGHFYRGILTGLNEAFVITSEQQRDGLVAQDPKSAEIIKPFLRGKDIKRWNVQFAEQYLIKIESSENKQHPWSGLPLAEAEKLFAKTYPAIYAWFISEGRRQQLIDRTDQGHYFWELRSCAYWEKFEQPKIIIPAIAASPIASIDELGYFSNNKSTIFIPTSIALASSCVNSPIAAWLATQTFATKQGGFFDFEPRYSGQIPIPPANTTQLVAIERIVSAITIGLAAPEYERLLNGLVYELFFPDDLHAKGIRLFDACAEAGIADWPAPDNTAGKKPLKVAQLGWNMRASSTADEIFHPSHPIYGMLFELQAVEVVRIIEGVA